MLRSKTSGIPRLTELDIGKCLLYTTDNHEITLNRDHNPNEIRNITMAIAEKQLSFQKLMTKSKANPIEVDLYAKAQNVMLDCPVKRRLLAPVGQHGISSNNRNMASYGQQNDSLGSIMSDLTSSKKLSPRRQYLESADVEVINRLSRIERVQACHAMDPNRSGHIYGPPLKTILPDPLPAQNHRIPHKLDKRRVQEYTGPMRQLPPISPPSVPLPSVPPANPVIVPSGRQIRGTIGKALVSTRPW